jgi:RNA-directed DNA polymerase
MGFVPDGTHTRRSTRSRRRSTKGCTWIIDADLASYFDTIPHDRLMNAVAERVVDGAMLALVASTMNRAASRHEQRWRA